MEVPVKVEMEEDIPLTKAGYTIPPTYPPIQVSYARLQGGRTTRMYGGSRKSFLHVS